MVDVFTKSLRSRVMSAIRKTDSKPEIIVRKYLHKIGFRYRKNVKTLPGCPDIVLKKHKTVIFINGCFWHAHKNCKLNKPPITNKKYWLPKIANNAKRDIKNNLQLKKMKWKVITVWECQLRIAKREKTLTKINNKLSSLDENTK